MAGVYFKGLPMPGGCADCPMNLGRSNGFAACAVICTAARYSELGESGRLDGCPAHFGPDHGRLIEAERIKVVFHKNVVGGEAFDQLIDIAPTIIPADKEDEK